MKASAMRGVIDKLDQLSSQLIRILEYLIAGLLACVWLVVATLVALRYVFNSSIPGANETVTMLFVFTTAIGAAVGIGRWEHVGVSVMVDRLPRGALWGLDLVRCALVGLINGVVVFYSLAWIRTTGQFVMPSTGLPRYVVQVSIPLGCALACLFCLIRLVSVYRAGRAGYRASVDPEVSVAVKD